MFIRPMGVTVRPANRPPGHPLLRGLLARASGAAEPTAGSVGAAGPAAAGPAEPPPGAPPEFPQPAERGQEPEPGWESGWESEPGPGWEPGPVAAIAPDHTAAGGPVPSTGLVAELTQLADLAREGLLTPQEFTTAKARLLRG
ncbi:SHOCT domain-containing protein [Streptomyces sp. NPDC058682]|uniref:SHOCT domain-containing protein n=1 Tax=unclassified Streptomyces TaxID=2593676 RepID=UPI002252901F|nr:SHOCT domain-containing protein [Streptomyces sp. NBC_01214]MCX4805731.1 SHOCT domain-containing protein [Streptomyces sp. NBC_01214]